jgi:FixJ family two-component response regulator
MIYVIDDDDSVRSPLQRHLRSTGLDVKAFSSAKKFLESGNPGERACIVLDIQMGGFTGFDLQEEPPSEGIRIPVIGIFALDDGKTRERARELVATAFLMKPVGGRALIDAIYWGRGFGEEKMLDMA